MVVASAIFKSDAGMIDLNLNNVVEIKPQNKSVGDAIDDFRRMATEHGLSISDVKISDNINLTAYCS